MDLTLDVSTQGSRYADFYSPLREPVRLLRYDVRYRARRMHELFAEIDIDVSGRRVLDVGFGWGDMLASFPRSCHIAGADISSSAVARAAEAPDLAGFASASFHVLGGSDPEDLPGGPFDVVLSAHTLEHVPDDRAMLDTMRRRLAPGGVLVVFVPVEEPDYCPIHLRVYSVQSLCEKVTAAGFELLHAEGNMQLEGGPWKVLSIPTRRRWPVLRYVASGLRHVTYSAFSYRALRGLDRALFRLGAGARQAAVVARRPLTEPRSGGR